MLKLANWIDLRPYSGLILTKSNKEDTQENENTRFTGEGTLDNEDTKQIEKKQRKKEIYSIRRRE